MKFRFFSSLGAGFLSFIASLILIAVSHHVLVWLGFMPEVASRSAIMGWLVATGIGFLDPEKEPEKESMKQYFEAEAMAYLVSGVIFGIGMTIAEGWEWRYLPGMFLSTLVYMPTIVLREIPDLLAA